MNRIKSIVMAGALSIATALGGCASTTGANTGTTAANNINSVIAQIQQASVAACSFLPTTATIANILGTVAGVGAETQLATTVASQICAAVSPAAKANRAAGAAPTVNGVVIHGRFVR